ISPFGVINLSIRVPKAPQRYEKFKAVKKRQTPGSSSRKEEKKDITTGHYLKFISESLNVIDKYESFRGFYLIMDNAPVH
ncbi:hypothetical protein EDC94DRAFT_487980, partial [Helicostylum pulchrum]